MQPFGLECHHVTSASITAAHTRLLALLDRHVIPATFAFVAASTMTRDEVRARPSWFSGLRSRGVDWFAAFGAAFAETGGDGWLCPEAFERVARAGGHEIASHGFSHVILHPDHIGDAEFDAEFAKVRMVGAMKQVAFRTLVYPCNQIGFTHRLAAHGILAYRAALASEESRARRARMKRLLLEFNILEGCQSTGAAGRPAALPEGRYLSHRHGLRALVPSVLTRLKVQAMLDDAVRRDRVLHLYCHPQEFIANESHYALLEAVLRMVSDRVRDRSIEAMTQVDYYRQRLAT